MVYDPNPANSEVPTNTQGEHYTVQPFNQHLYADGLLMATQQMQSKLIPWVTRKQLGGDRTYFRKLHRSPAFNQRDIDPINSASPAPADDRIGTTQLLETVRERRFMVPVWYNHPEIYDTLIDPVTIQEDMMPGSDQMMNIAAAWARDQDDVIFRGLGAPVIGTQSGGATGADGTTYPLATAMRVLATVATPTLFDVANVLDLAQLLDENDVPETDRVIVINPLMARQLLVSSEAILGSIEFNEVKALVSRRWGYFLGFNWIVHTSVPAGTENSGDSKRVYAWHRQGVYYGDSNLQVKISELPSNNHATQVYHHGHMNCIRMDENVVAYCDIHDIP